MAKNTNKGAKADDVPTVQPVKTFTPIRDAEEKAKRLAAALKKNKGKLTVQGADGETLKVKPTPVMPLGVEGGTVDCLHGRVGSRTQVIHSILIDAARRGVILTATGIQAMLESYLGKGHGAAGSHLNTLRGGNGGAGGAYSHPCSPVETGGGGTPYLQWVHDEETGKKLGMGLTYIACQLAGIKPADMPAWVIVPKKKK